MAQRPESEGRVDIVLKMREEAKECEKIALLEREQARIGRMIADEEKRRQDIMKRLQIEIHRLDSLRRA